MKVLDVADAIERAFPARAAESWDNVGLVMGDENLLVGGVACAVNATLSNIEAASAKRCNVLVTHHPPFLELPPKLHWTKDYEAKLIACALKNNVNIVSAHTNLDVSDAARDAIAETADYPVLGLQPVYGAVFDTGSDTVCQIADKLGESFDVQPQVVGAGSLVPGTATFYWGSASASATCLICGEASYHKCLAVTDTGGAVIKLGHGVSEKPFAKLLAQTIQAALGIKPHLLKEEL